MYCPTCTVSKQAVVEQASRQPTQAGQAGSSADTHTQQALPCCLAFFSVETVRTWLREATAAVEWGLACMARFIVTLTQQHTPATWANGSTLSYVVDYSMQTLSV